MKKNKIVLISSLFLLAGTFCNTKTMNLKKKESSKLIFNLKLFGKKVSSANTSSEAQTLLNQINNEEKAENNKKSIFTNSLLSLAGFTTCYCGSRLLDDQHKNTEKNSKLSYKKYSLTLVSALGCGAMFSGGALALNNIKKEITLWKTKDQRQILKNKLIKKIKSE